MVTDNCSGRDDRMERTCWDGKDLLDMRDTPGNDDNAWEKGMHEPVLYGQRTVRIAVKAFGVSSDLLTPDQTGEAAVKEPRLLQRYPRISME